jgi:hypothetical protein
MFLGLLSVVCKNKEVLLDHLAVSVTECLYLYPSLLTFEWLNRSLWNLMHVSRHLSCIGKIHKFVTSVIPPLQTLKFLRQNLNTSWIPVLIYTKLGMHIQNCLPYCLHYAYILKIPFYISDTQIKMKGKWAINSSQNFLSELHLLLKRGSSIQWYGSWHITFAFGVSHMYSKASSGWSAPKIWHEMKLQVWKVLIFQCYDFIDFVEC